MTRDDHAVNHDAHAASVLIVDDTIDTLRLLSDLLSEHGYDVRAVTNGRLRPATPTGYRSLCCDAGRS